MNVTEAKKKIDKTGFANLTLFNDKDGYAVIGNVDKMTTKDGRVRLVWKLPKVTHTSSFVTAVIHDKTDVFWTDSIKPLRLDDNVKKFEVDWDV